MRCIITGFESFDGGAANPSELAVKRLEPRLKLSKNRTVEVDRLVLPVCGLDGWQALRKAVDALDKRENFLLVLSGLADGRDKVSLERIALNVRHYSIADNCGDKHPESPISTRAPLALRTDVNIPAILRALKRKKVRATISHHAGTFICNETYFRALHRWKDDLRCLGIVFVHFPAIATYRKHKGKKLKKKAVLARYAEILTTVATTIHECHTR